MFSEIHGLPLHPLAVHAAVVLTPLAAFLAVLFVVPRTRAWARLPMALVSVGAGAALFVARQSGISLDTNLYDRGVLVAQNPATALVIEHRHRANQLCILMIILGVIALAAYFLSRDQAKFQGALAIGFSVALIVAAGAVAFQTYRVGDIGSKAVWNPDGTVDYSN